MGAAPYRAVNGLFSVGVEAIFIAADLSGCGDERRGILSTSVIPRLALARTVWRGCASHPLELSLL